MKYNYKFLTDLPQEIQNNFKANIAQFYPMDRLEYIVQVGRDIGASDIHITPVDYDENNCEPLVLIKYRIDGDLDNYIYNLGEKYHNDPRSYIKMTEYKEFTYAIKDNIVG